MVNEDILGGLKSGLERGESLPKVMASFYNAGYKKEEIEDAARALSSDSVPSSAMTAEPKQIPNNSESPEKNRGEKKEISPLVKETPKVNQKASDYGKTKESSKNKIMIILMIVLAVIFAGVLALFLLTSK